MKTCSKCNTSKSVTEFSKHSRRSDGLQPYCKWCCAAYYTTNHENIAAMQATYRASNLDRCKATQSSWQKANQDKVKAYRSANQERAKENKAAYYAANSNKAKLLASAWNKANPEARRIHANNRRARKCESGGKLSKGLAVKLFNLQRGKCACGCGQSLGNNYHMDHRMPLALGGENEDWNIQLLTATCNIKKGAKDPIDFMQSRGFLI